MPRAFCPECGSEVPVDAEGVCHVGHLVDRAATGAAAAAPAVADDPDEPEPWVASVDEAPAAPTPEPSPPAAHDEPLPAAHDEPLPAVQQVDAGHDDLAAAAAAAAASLSAGPQSDDHSDDRGDDGTREPADGADEASDGPATWHADTGDEDDVAAWHGDIQDGIAAPGWSPPGDPILPPPQPPPAPLEPPRPAAAAAAADDLAEFDFDDLEASLDAGGGTPDAATTRHAPDYPDDDVSPAATFQELAGDRTTSPPSPGDGLPATAPRPEARDRDAAPPARPAPPPTSPPPSAPPAAGDETVDLSNFTARGGRGRGGSEQGGRFRRR